MMPDLNLIPAHRQAARQRRVRRGRAVVTCAAYASVVAAVSVGARAVVVREDAAVPGLLDQAAADVALTTETLAKVRGELDAADSLLRSSRAIAEQPDWSTLMALLAAKAGDEVVLKALTVRPQDPPTATAKPAAGRAAAAKPAAADPGVVVTVTGAGPSQAAASQFALRLEATRLFGRVALIDTNRDGFADLPLVSFRIECALGGGAGGPSGPPAAAADGAKAAGGPANRGSAAGRGVATGGEP
jgi:hypothetical protein